MFRNSDIILIIFLAVIAIWSMFIIGARLKTSKTVLITIDGNLYDKVSINENKTINIVQENIHILHDG